MYEKKNDHEIFGTLLLKSELPLKKELENSTNFLKPIIQLRVSPTNGKNISSSDTRIEFDNLFSPNRIGRSDMVEKGNSITEKNLRLITCLNIFCCIYLYGI